MSSVIEVRDLARTYGDLEAVKDISFDVEEGEIFGFLGPNGAGKSTTISMLCTLLKPTRGSAVVAGHDVASERHAVRQNIGLIFQDSSLDDRLTGRENLSFHAMLYDVPGDVARERAKEVLEMVDLAERADDAVSTYSGGMRRRLEIARGLLHHPRVLFLDEPTLGLDPQTRRHIWDYLLDLKEREDLTVFLTTHYMDEAEHCDRIAIIDHGEIVALDTPEALKAMVGGDLVTLATPQGDLAEARLRKELSLDPRRGPRGEVILEVEHGDRFIPQLMTTLGDSGSPIQVDSVNLRQPSLEDVFVKITGRAIRDEEASGTDQMRRFAQRFRRH